MAIPFRNVIAAVFIAAVVPVPTFTADRPASLVKLEAGAEAVLTAMRLQAFQSMSREKPSDGIVSKPAWQAAAFVGREDLFARQEFDSLPPCVALEANPLEVLVERARKTNVVIINEHHAAPLHRLFVGRVLEALRPEGYGIYAAETFSTLTSLDHEETLGQDGWYSNEPVFARTVRLARELGYSLVPYEQTPAQAETQKQSQPTLSPQDAREQSQASNLVSAIFSREPSAKVIIHVGHSHVRERKAPWAPRTTVYMAELLAKAIGRDPLTISQVDCRSQTSGDVVAEQRSEGDQGSPVDLFIGHPAPEFSNGRPTWRLNNGDLPVEVPRQFMGLPERVIVEARRLSASLAAAPTDSILLYPGERLSLLLPLGRYRVDGFLESGRVAGETAVVDVATLQELVPKPVVP